ncbi:hypothetical protein [Lysobacter sp. A289]
MRSKILVLLALAVAAFISGAADQYFYPGVITPPSAFAFAVVGGLLIFAWYRLDSDQLGYRRSPWLNVGVVGLSLLALPYYFFRSRGVKRGTVASVVFIAALLLLGVIGSAGQYATYYGLQA